ncbi:unnamed protein product, partial [Amoebophrya sp. A25]
EISWGEEGDCTAMYSRTLPQQSEARRKLETTRDQQNDFRVDAMSLEEHERKAIRAARFRQNKTPKVRDQVVNAVWEKLNQTNAHATISSCTSPINVSKSTKGSLLNFTPATPPTPATSSSTPPATRSLQPISSASATPIIST